MYVKIWKRLACVLVAALVCTFDAHYGYPRAGLAQKRSVRRESQPVVYLALGDSTGVGIGARSGNGYVERLFMRIEKARPGSSVINLCAKAATTSHVLREQISQLQDVSPTLITVGIGANDLIHGVKAEQFARNYEQIIVQLKERAKAFIVTMNIPDVSLAPAVPAYMRDAARRQILIFNKHIKEIARRYNLVVIDLYEKSYEFSLHPKFFSADGIHPSDAGYEFWAGLIWPSVESILRE